MTHDAPRLLMSVHLALRNMKSGDAGAGASTSNQNRDLQRAMRAMDHK